MARLTFIVVGLAGLVGDIDASHTGYAAKSGLVCADHSCGSLQRDLRADLWGDPAILSRHSRTLGGRREKLLVLCLVEFYDKWLDRPSHEVNLCTTTYSSWRN